jgi:phosphoribosyl 1,2-cyclic phosphodiesterase
LEASGASRTTARLLLSSPRWDHINGLPFFAPLYVGGNEIEIMGPSQGNLSTRALVAAQFDPMHSSVEYREIVARVFFRDLAEAKFNEGPCAIQTMLLDHPGNCLGYRISYDDRVLCYVPSTELPRTDSQAYSQNFDSKLAEFLHGADVAVMDTTYSHGTPERERRRGYADLERVGQVCHEAQVRELHLFHHAPSEDDEMIDRKLDFVRNILAGLGSSTRCIAPSEGTTIAIGARKANVEFLTRAA